MTSDARLDTRIAGLQKHHALRDDGKGVSANPNFIFCMLTEKSSAKASPNPPDKPSVLVVDDEYGPRESIAFSLASDFTVDTAERAREALEKLKAKPYGAVVLDIRMPEMDGIRALEELRKIDQDVS